MDPEETKPGEAAPHPLMARVANLLSQGGAKPGPWSSWESEGSPAGDLSMRVEKILSKPMVL